MVGIGVVCFRMQVLRENVLQIIPRLLFLLFLLLLLLSFFSGGQLVRTNSTPQGKDQSTVVPRAETTVDEHFLASCV